MPLWAFFDHAMTGEVPTDSPSSQEETEWVLFEPLIADPHMKFRDPLPDLGVRIPSHPAR